MLCRFAAVLGTLVWILAGPCKVQAAQATYTLSSVGTGHVGSHFFSMTPFTITCTADTSQITNSVPGVFHVPNITTTISVPGVITATLTGPMATYIDHTDSVPNAFGLADPIQQLPLLAATTDSTLENYDLSTSTGPVTGSPGYCYPFNYFSTTAGILSLSSVSDVTFQSIVVPEPSTGAIFAFGFVGIVSQRCGRRS